MYSKRKYISIMLTLLMLVSISLSGCEKTVGESIGDFFSGIFGVFKSKSVATEVQFPDRPYIIDTGGEETESLSGFLQKTDAAVEKLLSEPLLEEQILSAKKLDDIADSKTETDNLKKFRG
jgi:hypothetical protein